MSKLRRRKGERKFRRAWRYLTAFSLQVYLSVAFLYMAAVVFTSPTGVVPEGFWPLIFVAASLGCVASILRPFSPTVAAGTGALIATVSAARAASIFSSGPSMGTPQLIGIALWGLFVVVGMRWPRIAYDSGVKHLLDTSREANEREPKPSKRAG